MWFGYTPQVSHRIHGRLVVGHLQQAVAITFGNKRQSLGHTSGASRVEIGGRQESHVHKFSIHLRTAAICAVSSAVAWTAAAPCLHAQTGNSSPAAKKYKEGEYEIVTQSYKDVGDAAKELVDLDTWAQKFPDSDYKDDRGYLYVQACLKLNQPAKVLEYGSQLMSRDLSAIFNGTGTEQLAGLPIKLTMLNVLYSVALNAAALPGATPDQLALGGRAARALVEFAPKYFTPENRTASQTEAAWAAARADVMSKASTAMVAIALKPGLEAQQKKDCPGQESAFSKALGDYPESGAAAYQMGVALLSCEAGNPDKVSQGLWEIARASSMDPAKSGMDPKDLPGIETYLKKVYARIHGSEEGIEKLKQQAAGSPVPPAGFKIQSSADIALEKQAEFDHTNPQLALWMKIRSQLADTNGDQYFQGQLKDAAVPQLTGTLVEAKPACHPKELLVAVPMPDAPKPFKAEITLKLDKPLGGKPELESEFRWEGVPTAFTKDPMMLTMDTDTVKLGSLKTVPCTAAPVSSGAKKGTATKKN